MRVDTRAITATPSLPIGDDHSIKEHTMKQRSVAILVGLASMLAFFAASSSAATVSINPVVSNGTAGATSLIDSTAGRTLNCTSAGLTATFVRGGGATGSVSNQTFNSCTESQTGATLTFSRTANWTATVSALLSGTSITGVLILITVPAGGAHFSGPLCDFDISGTQAALTTVTPATPPALVSVSTIPVPGVGTLGLVLNLRISNVSGLGCAVLGVRNGDASRFSGTYRLATPITGTLV